MDSSNAFTTSAGVKVPWLIYGTAWKKQRTNELVEKAVLAGFRGIDTACQPRHYSEPLVGEALKRLEKQSILRDSLYLQSKYTPVDGQDPFSVPYDQDAPVATQVAQSFQVSLNNLQTSYLDCLVLHSPLPTYDMTFQAWAAMEQIHAAGGVRQLGLSNCYHLSLLEKLFNEAKVKPAVLQNRFYQETAYDVEIRKWCNGHSILYQSFWTLTANPHKLADKAIVDIAENCNRTVPQVFFRFLNQSGIAVLTGTCSEQHMQEDLAILDFTLTDEEVSIINRLLGTPPEIDAMNSQQ